MACRLCELTPVWKFTNQQQLCKKCFSDYFEKKVRATIRKYQMPIAKLNSKNLKSKIVNKTIANLSERKGNLNENCLNDISNSVLFTIINKNFQELSKLLPKNSPLYFLSEKEILLYAKIHNIKGRIKQEKNKKFAEINEFINSFEAKNADIRQNIVNALIKVS